MRKIYKLLTIGLSAALLVFSCTKDFESINTNPNAPDRITDPSLILPGIILDAANRNVAESFYVYGVLADQFEENYMSSFTNLTRNFSSGQSWANNGMIKNIYYMIDLSQKQGLANYQAAGLVLKSWIFLRITDSYGPIPYTEAGRANEGVNFPKYDSQETIYAGLLKDLETANTLLGTTTELISGDILYNGNIQNWKKFANSLSLRILLRQSGRKNPSVGMQKIIENPSTYPIFTSHKDQAALQYLNKRANAHPIFLKQPSNWQGSEQLTQNLEVILKSMNDPRLAVFAMPTPASVIAGGVPQYFGVPNGMQQAETTSWNGGVKNQSTLGLLWAPEQFSLEFASPNAAQSVFMPYSELEFILAEAKEKGYITTGDAQTYYMNGIQDQFAYYASRIPTNFILPTAATVIPPSSYYTQANVAYAGTQTEKLHKIYTQKWLSLFFCGSEAWAEWRRVGVPTIIPGPNTNGYVPVRLLYPADEMLQNVANYQEAVKMLGGEGDALTTHVWWDVD
jgi:hypothetical protein